MKLKRNLNFYRYPHFNCYFIKIKGISIIIRLIRCDLMKLWNLKYYIELGKKNFFNNIINNIIYSCNKNVIYIIF